MTCRWRSRARSFDSGYGPGAVQIMHFVPVLLELLYGNINSLIRARFFRDICHHMASATASLWERTQPKTEIEYPAGTEMEGTAQRKHGKMRRCAEKRVRVRNGRTPKKPLCTRLARKCAMITGDFCTKTGAICLKYQDSVGKCMYLTFLRWSPRSRTIAWQV
jgi:hypothetical protein